MRTWYASLRNGFAGIFRFSGRDDRALYWPYVFTLVAAMFAAMMAVMLPTMADSMVRMQRFAAEHPDQATITRGPGSYSITIEGSHPELMPDTTGMIPLIGGVAVVFVLLIAAATIRRLRDNGRGVWWALPPVVLLALGLSLMAKLMASITGTGVPRFDLFFLLFANNLLYLASLALLVFQLARSPRMPSA